MSKLDALIEATAGTPEVEKEEDGNPATPEDEKEVEKEADSEEEDTEKEDEDEESEVAKSLKVITSELSEMKKQIAANKVVEVVKSELPAVVNKAEKETYTMTDVMKGKVSMQKFIGETQ